MPVHSESVQARDIASHLHSYTNLRQHQEEGPLVITRGDGVFVYDEAGHSYLEGMAGLWCATLGFSESRLVEAGIQQLKTLPFYHTFYNKVPKIDAELADRLVRIAPGAMSKALFAGSGSESNDTALKLTWYYNNAIGRPNKKKIISRVNAYHGVTIATASLTGMVTNHLDFDLPIERVLHTDCPHLYRFGLPSETEEEFATRLARSLENLILKEGPETIAAFIAEPVMAAGGVIVPPETYFDKIQAVLKRYDILFIVDEVVCGFGRTGNLFGSQTFNIQPDMVVVAKGLSAAYQPISALLISERIYQVLLQQSEKFGMFNHGFTYGGHPVAAAVALEALKVYEERNIVEHVRQVSPRLQEGLRKFADHPLVGEVRGIGLIAGVELVSNKQTKEPFHPSLAIGAQVVRRAQEHGLILRPRGDTIAIAPPLIISEAEIDLLLERFDQALNETWAALKPKSVTVL